MNEFEHVPSAADLQSAGAVDAFDPDEAAVHTGNGLGFERSGKRSEEADL
jgi:hypothetical protein